MFWVSPQNVVPETATHGKLFKKKKKKANSLSSLPDLLYALEVGPTTYVL